MEKASLEAPRSICNSRELHRIYTWDLKRPLNPFPQSQYAGVEDYLGRPESVELALHTMSRIVENYPMAARSTPPYRYAQAYMQSMNAS